MGTDGEGIRALIVTGGCPLRCRYCINPFTWNNPTAIKRLTAREVYEKFIIDRPYMLATNGGITVGGGEPLIQPQLIQELRKLCDPEITIFVETSLKVPWENIDLIKDVVDKFYIDIKTMDPDIYKKYTGSDIELLLINLEKLLIKIGPENLIIRIPTIPGLVDRMKQRESMTFLKNWCMKEIL